MSNESKKTKHKSYEIKIKGRLGESWAEWFEPLLITYTEEGNTILKGELVDQAALQGVLTNLGNLNIELISVNPVEAESNPSIEEDDL